MDQNLHKIEVIVDRLIPWMIILLLFILIGDFFFVELVEEYNLHPWMKAGDSVVIIIFTLDLIFKYVRVRKIPFFLKKYWLEILAVFPFFLFFRLFEGIFSFFVGEETLVRSQSLFHETIEVEREVVKISQEAEKVAKVSRTSAIMRMVRPLARFPRFLKYLPRLKSHIHFYEKPTGRHYPGEKIREKKEERKGKKINKKVKNKRE